MGRLRGGSAWAWLGGPSAWSAQDVGRRYTKRTVEAPMKMGRGGWCKARVDSWAWKPAGRGRPQGHGREMWSQGKFRVGPTGHVGVLREGLQEKRRGEQAPER